MALIELYCPRCGGDVRMDRSMVFGTCESCGARCMLQEMVPRRTEVSVQGAPTVDGLVDLALRSWLIGDEESSYRAVVDALSTWGAGGSTPPGTLSSASASSTGGRTP